MAYFFGSHPQAERAARETINLPTHRNITLTQAQRVMNFLQPIRNTMLEYDMKIEL